MRGEGLPILAFIALFFLCVFGVPPNMDEFSAYQPLYCHLFPHGGENVFREGCGLYGLRYGATTLPLRSYAYVGSAQALRYLPIYLLWPHYFSARLEDLFALLLIYFAVRKISGLRAWPCAALVFLCFPLVYQLAVDTGPVSFDLAMVLALPLLLVRTRRLSVAAAVGFLAFVAFWDKPFFVVAVPSMIGLGALLWMEDRSFTALRPGRAESARITVAGGTGLLFSALLLLGKNASGVSLFEELRASGFVRPGVEQWNALVGHWSLYATSFRNFTDKIYGGGSVFDRSSFVDPATTLFWSVTLGAVAAAVLLRGVNRRTAMVSGGFVLAALCLFFVNRVGASYAGHHLVFVWPFLLVAFAAAFRVVDERWRAFGSWVFVPLAISGFALGFATIGETPRPESAWDRVPLNRMLRSPEIGARYVQVVVDWGMFYYQSLYGDRDQLVLYVEPLRETWKAGAVRAIAARTGRRVLFIGRRNSVSDWNLIHAAFPSLRPLAGPDVAPDSEWMALAEP